MVAGWAELAFVDDSVPAGHTAPDRGALSIVYPDGSCLFCLVGAGSTASGTQLLAAVRTPAFRPDGGLSARIQGYPLAPRIWTSALTACVMGRPSLTHLTRRGPRPGGWSCCPLRPRDRITRKRRRSTQAQVARTVTSGGTTPGGWRLARQRTEHRYLAITDASGRHLRRLT